jgi:TfoX/Sxy family transcriptional regulator of competence genes
VTSGDADALFERLTGRFSSNPAVTLPSSDGGKGFGASALKVDGKIFAMVSKGELVVKLPRQRVEELIAAGTGTRFDPGHGRVMKEWLSVATEHERSWPELAQEALEFVGATAR